MRSTPAARIASSTVDVAIVFCSRSARGCSSPWRTSAFAARWNTVSHPSSAPLEQLAVEHVALARARRPVARSSAGDELAPAA